MTSGTVLFLDVSIVELVHLLETGTCTVWAIETRGHTSCFSRPCGLPHPVHFSGCIDLAGDGRSPKMPPAPSYPRSRPVCGLDVVEHVRHLVQCLLGTIPGTQTDWGRRRWNLGFLVSAATASPLCWGSRNESTSRVHSGDPSALGAGQRW